MNKTPEQWINEHIPFDVGVAKALMDLERRVKGLEWLAHGDGFEPGKDAIPVTLTEDQINLLLNITTPPVEGLPASARDMLTDAREQLKIALYKLHNPSEGPR